MSERRRIWLLVFPSYAVARFAWLLLYRGSWQMNFELASHVLIVPAVQIAVLELLRVVMSRRPRTNP